MSDSRNSSFLSRFLPTFFLFIIGILALVFSVITSKLNRSDARIRFLTKSEDTENDV